jgi:NAD(P)-dependent dehydrogenase (short-subunit alcohol dehydrogenase family)
VDEPDRGPNACCESAAQCVFAKALLARSAQCAVAVRRSAGERELLDCGSAVARINCATLAGLMHERSRFALRLPGPGHPMIHAQALRLHCGGLAGVRHALGADDADVHALVTLAHQRHGSLTALPWGEIVPRIVAWQPRARRRSSDDAPG